MKTVFQVFFQECQFQKVKGSPDYLVILRKPYLENSPAPNKLRAIRFLIIARFEGLGYIVGDIFKSGEEFNTILCKCNVEDNRIKKWFNEKKYSSKN